MAAPPLATLETDSSVRSRVTLTHIALRPMKSGCGSARPAHFLRDGFILRASRRSSRRGHGLTSPVLIQRTVTLP